MKESETRSPLDYLILALIMVGAVLCFFVVAMKPRVPTEPTVPSASPAPKKLLTAVEIAGLVVPETTVRLAPFNHTQNTILVGKGQNLEMTELPEGTMVGLIETKAISLANPQWSYLIIISKNEDGFWNMAGVTTEGKVIENFKASALERIGRGLRELAEPLDPEFYIAPPAGKAPPLGRP